MDNIVDYFRSEIVNASDYTPFGVQMDGRKFVIDDYRYSFNGMEKTDEIYGSGNEYTTEFRQYDSRLGRWMSRDTKANEQPYQSPYCAMDNNPVVYNDPKGDIVDKGKFFSKEGIRNRWHNMWNRAFSPYYRDLFKTRDADPNKVYHQEYTKDKDIPTMQDGGQISKNSEGDYQWKYTKGFVIRFACDPPTPCDDNTCVPAQNDPWTNESSSIFPHTESRTYRVSPGTTFTFTTLGRPDRIRIYSGGKKIFDSGKVIQQRNDPLIINLDTIYNNVQCNTVKVRVTSGFRRPTWWQVLVNIPGTCN
jgi:RHS repeat-associated protein